MSLELLTGSGELYFLEQTVQVVSNDMSEIFDIIIFVIVCFTGFCYVTTFYYYVPWQALTEIKKE